MEQGCLVRDCQFVPPAAMHSRILGLVHMGHPGITHMQCKVHETYWWPGLNAEVHDLVNQCIGCQFSKKTMPSAYVPKIEIPKLSGSWEKIG